MRRFAKDGHGVGLWDEATKTLVVLTYEGMPWSQGSARVVRKCHLCREPIPVGAKSFRPLSSGAGRYRRLCLRCAHKLGGDAP